MRYVLVVLILVRFFGCTTMVNSQNINKDTMKVDFVSGTYGYDTQFLKKHCSLVELRNEDAAIVIVPAYQGRVMTSTCRGDYGFSFGWINHEAISSNILKKQFNPFGGEERFWLGPEGGQFSLYFSEGQSFDFQNWQVPSVIDKESFELVKCNKDKALFRKQFKLTNYSGFEFNAEVNREITLLSKNQIEKYLNLDCDGISLVAYQSANDIKNIGLINWTKDKGLISIWMLGMYIPSDDVCVVIPVQPGNEEKLGPKVKDDYFGKVSEDRLKLIDDVIYFRADGKSRGKIGVSPRRATKFMGSYDAKNLSLTILECELPADRTDFVNSAWEIQENPFSGDALNSYNDGPLEDGSQMGPFYELESSSPALELKSQESYTHVQRTYHFQGDLDQLNQIAENILGVSLNNIKDIMKH
jgi:hypothetical protein